MATTIPSDIEEFGTEGEKAFFKFLESVAKPDSHYTCWCLPDVSGNEPDFILYCDDVGLVIFEVKDWALGRVCYSRIPMLITVQGPKSGNFRTWRGLLLLSLIR